jgi:hypothetical protein
MFNEAIFLAIFLTAADLLCITGFVYFSGGVESAYVPLYLFILISIPITMPQFQYGIFVWTLTATFLYDAMLLMTYFDLVPFYSRHTVVLAMGPANLRLSLISCFLTPAIFLFFAVAVYIGAGYLRGQRARLEEEVARETELGKQVQGFAEVHSILTHVFTPEKMLNQTLKKLLEVLHLSSGLILTLEPRGGLVCRSRQGVPAELVQVFQGKSLKAAAGNRENLKEIVVAGESIQNISSRKLIFHRRELGLLVLFGKEGEPWLEPKLAAQLQALVDEIGAAVFYSIFLGRLGRGKKKS